MEDMATSSPGGGLLSFKKNIQRKRKIGVQKDYYTGKYIATFFW